MYMFNSHIPVEPNLHTILLLVPLEALYFPLVDFCSAFLTVPRYLFTFSIEGQQYTWTFSLGGLPNVLLR